MLKHERKVPFVLQTQKTECGLACVCMISRYYRNNISMEELRSKLEIGRDGSSFQQLIKVMEEIGLDVKSYHIPFAKANLISTPAILFWKNNHFIVIEKIKKNDILVVDPSIGRYRMTYDEFEEGYTGYLVVPRPGEKFEIHKKKIHSWHYFIPYILKHKLQYLKIILLSFLTYGLTIGMPMIVQYIIDNISYKNRAQNESPIFLMLAVMGVLFFLTSLAKNEGLVKLRAFIDRDLNVGIFSHLLRLPYKFFSVRSSGDIIYSLNSCFNVREVFANQFISSILDCGAAIVIIVYIICISRILGVLAMLLFAINIIVIGFTRPFLLDNARSITSTQSNVQGIQMEAVYAMLGVKMSAIEDEIFSTWNKAYGKYYQKNLANERIKNYIESLTSFLQFISPAILLFVGIYLANRGYISIGAIIAIYSLGNTFFGLSVSVLNMWNSFINSSVIFDRLVDIIRYDEEDENTQGEVKRLNGNIELKNVCFKYTKDSMEILHSINLKINAGMKVAIVGKSGSGKSTLAKLLVGLYEPTEGEVFFDGIALSKWKKKELRKQVGIVPQDITLFNDSIYNNIVMNRENIQLEEVKRVCGIAHISEEIESMPMQYYTEVSELGLNLSGGQRQRIALARAIIGNPKILLLDEATSSLDNVNEKLVSNEIKKMGTTQVIIAHRLSTIIDSDLIVVLDGGKIVEVGKHDELLKKQGVYFDLYANLS